MQIPERYEHAKEVYRSFQKRTAALSKWLKEVTEKINIQIFDEFICIIHIQMNSYKKKIET